MTNAKKKNFFKRLVDKSDTSVALSSIIIISLLIVGLLLLTVPLIILIIEAYYNHTITTDLNGMAAYIGAVTAIFVTAGSIKFGIHWTDEKLERTKIEHGMHQNEECDIE